MKITVTQCDLCDEIIPPGEAFVVKTDENVKKQVGCDFVLTPKGNRLHTSDGKCMIRVQAGFYCGSHPVEIDELHFHEDCINAEVRKRVVHFFTRGE
jgi:hypothetical protein